MIGTSKDFVSSITTKRPKKESRCKMPHASNSISISKEESSQEKNPSWTKEGPKFLNILNIVR